MIEFDDHFEEEYLYLADVTHEGALVAWGKFFFSTKMELIRDRDIHMLDGQQGRHQSIGAAAESYGTAVVDVLDAAGVPVSTSQTTGTRAWVTGLSADTDYTYRVTVDGREWADGTLHTYDPVLKELLDTGERYENAFRTAPAPDQDAPLAFAIIGDFGTGFPTQQKVARELEKAVHERGVRLVMTVGDVIYAKSGGSGDDDNEWLLTYFQPYRKVINRLPVYPLIGNHDTSETLFSGEKQTDRLGVYDNLHVLQRFANPSVPGRDSSITPGLHYRFKWGSAIEFICLDTSKENIFAKRMFRHPKHKEYVTQVFASPLGDPRWRIPFTHHPPYCKGPRHDDSSDVQEKILEDLCVPNGVRVLFSGHEHNFQCLDSSNTPDRVRCFVTGGAGQFREELPTRATEGYMHCFGGSDRGHFLVVEINGKVMDVRVIDEGGRDLPLFDLAGQPLLETPIQVRLP